MGNNMKLGLFDSGLGGVMIARSIRASLPDIDMVYLGDTLHVPYGNRSEEAIYTYTKAAIEHLFTQYNCQLIVVACNTSSASALRRLQQTYLPKAFPNRRILGVVVPTIEYAIEKGHTCLGLIGTNYTVTSRIYEEELLKINPDIKIHQANTPLLVPLIENDGMAWIEDVLDHYIQPLLEKNIEALILSCTHYTCLKEIIRERYNIDVYAQDEIVPLKLAEYLKRHPEIDNLISKTGDAAFYVTDLTESYAKKATEFYGESVDLSPVQISEKDVAA